MQALEAIKIILNQPVLAGRLLLFDAADTTFRNIKLRSRNAKCKVCGEKPEIQELIDYEQFCGTRAHDKVENICILEAADNVEVQVLKALPPNSLAVDVRSQIEFSMFSLPDTINIPYSEILKGEGLDVLKKEILAKGAEETRGKICARCFWFV